MIIDIHGHYTTAPKALENWRNACEPLEKLPLPLAGEGAKHEDRAHRLRRGRQDPR
jgi:hypothetical protein